MDDLEFIAKEDSWPIVLPGKYQVVYLRHEKRRYFSGAKLYVWFRVVSCGENKGCELFKPYNFYDHLPRGCELYKDLGFLYGRRICKNTKLPMSLFRNKVFIVQVRTVEKNRKQEPLPMHQRYSVVDRIVEIAAGGGVQ